METPVVQGNCIACHVSGGLSGHTRLVFSAGAGNALNNFNVFDNFVSTVENGSQTILNKVRGGDAHGGGARFGSTSAEYLNLQAFLNALTGDTGSSSQTNFYQKVSFETPESTLRRASLLLAGRLPTEQEISQAAQSSEALTSTIKSLMTGSGFHDFLIRGANDNLLTDAFIDGLFLEVLDSNAAQYPVLATARYNAYSSGNEQTITDFNRWWAAARYGVARAPLELIAYVVENDRPYTEVLTADYTLVNPQSNTVLQAGASFSTPEYSADNVTEFQVGRNQGQILMTNELDAEYSQTLGLNIFSAPAPIAYPHAGLLNEPAFLNRYPTTDTNRNRARSRWTYYHFLGVDIEKSAARTTDPVALADTNNPTLNNPACAVCHQLMDPVAGAYQNYGDQGWYRTSDGGLDSLPDAYKNEENSPYIFGDTWFADMRTPGFNGTTVPNADTSLQWLASQITADDRFASATVKFWWETVMSDVLLLPPENSSDANFEYLLAAYEAQQELIDDLAQQFITGFNGGAPYNLKDLLAAMVTSDWFRANGASEALSSAELVALANVGNRRLLTPAELQAKTESLLGYAWGEGEAPWQIDNYQSSLLDRYRIYYGGIDSTGITERAKELNSIMSNVAEAQALAMACPSVLFDMNRDESSRLIFTQVDRYVTPTLHTREDFIVTGTSTSDASSHNLVHSLNSGDHLLRLSFANPYWDANAGESALLTIHTITVTAGDTTLFNIEGQNITEVPGVNIYRNDEGNYTGTPYWDGDLGALTGWLMWNGYIELPISLSSDASLSIAVTASRQNMPERNTTLSIELNSVSPTAGSNGEQAIRAQLQAMHKNFLGETLAANSEELTNTYNFLVELWQARQSNNYPQAAVAWDVESCEIPIEGWWDQDRSAEFADPYYMQGTWASVLVYFLTDYYYLHE